MSFWKMVLAVALGVLLAGVVSAAFSLVFFGAMVASFLDDAPVKSVVVPASIVGFGAAQIEIERYRAEQERVLKERAARIERDRPPRYPAPPAHATPGALYCLHGYVVRREVNGWGEVKSPAGQRIACRTS